MYETLETLIQIKVTGIWNDKVTTFLDNGGNRINLHFFKINRRQI
jgi:hypothetical protein